MRDADMPHVIDTATIPGWGVDADPRNDPTYPMRDRSGEPSPRDAWVRPTPQESDIEVLQSNEYLSRPAIFGTGPAPTGLSGSMRRGAFRYSENDWRHWLLLMAADRVNVLEGIAADIGSGRVPNIPAEKGAKARWEHDRASMVQRTAVTIALATALGFVLARRMGDRRNSRRALAGDVSYGGVTRDQER